MVVTTRDETNFHFFFEAIYLTKFDAIVIGAGPAGATAAYELSRKNLNVLVIEKNALPRNKVCAGFVSAMAVKLINFDISAVVEQDIYDFEFSFKLGEKFVTHTQEPRGYTVDRSMFDYLLVENAEKAGAFVVDGEKVKRLEAVSGGINVLTENHSFAAPIIIGADGAYGVTARFAGLMSHRQKMTAIEAKVPFSDNEISDNWRSKIQMDFGVMPGGYGWVFPKSDNFSVGAMTYPRFANILKEYIHEVISYIGFNGLNLENTKICLLPIRNPFDVIQRGRVLLLGDSAGLTNPLSGEGIYYAIKSAQLAAPVVDKCLKDDEIDLQPYQDKVDRQIMPVFKKASAQRSFYTLFPSSYFDLLKKNGVGDALVV